MKLRSSFSLILALTFSLVSSAKEEEPSKNNLRGYNEIITNNDNKRNLVPAFPGSFSDSNSILSSSILTTPEARAQQWFAGHPGLLPSQRDQSIALVTFYYATKGDITWKVTDDWLSYETSECGWYNQAEKNSCDDDQQLIELELEANGLNGTLPSALGDLTNLEKIDLEDNSIGGTLPEIMGRLVNLEELNLETNQFTGFLPFQLGNLINLEELRLKENSLYGAIPSQYGLMETLEVFDLSKNQLSGSLPTELTQLKNLERFDVYYNYWLNGTIPSALYTLPLLEDFKIEYNYFTGTLPTTIGLSSSLQFFNVKDNYLNGTIPTEIGNITTLIELELDGNAFTGSIPSEIANLQNLHVLKLEDNQLSGSIQDLKFPPSIQEIYLKNNAELSGSLPLSMVILANLTALDISGTNVVGVIPAALCDIDELVFDCKATAASFLCGCSCECPFANVVIGKTAAEEP